MCRRSSTSHTKPSVNGISASEVTCMSHASVVPDRAEPRNRTRASGVRRPEGWSVIRGTPLPDRIADRPGDQRQDDPADQRRPRQLIAHRGVHAVARVPDEMPDATDKVVKQRPGETEKNEPAEG